MATKTVINIQEDKVVEAAEAVAWDMEITVDQSMDLEVGVANLHEASTEATVPAIGELAAMKAVPIVDILKISI